MVFKSIYLRDKSDFFSEFNKYIIISREQTGTGFLYFKFFVGNNILVIIICF